MHSLYVYRFFAQLRMTGQKESKRKAKRCRALKKGGEVFKKDAELFLKPQGLLATSGVGCMASVYIHIGNANIHIGNVNIRIGSHVRTHRATRTYASGNTYVRIEQHGRTHWPIHIYVSCQAPSYPASRFDSLTSPCFCRCAKLRVETESTKKRMCQN